jgi:hypothetical protein
MAVDGSNAFFRANSTNNILFQVAGGTNVMALTNGGNVGIGTTSPTVIGANYRTLEVTSPTGGGYVIVSDSSGVKGEIAADGAIYVSSKSAHPMIFRTTDTERMRITSGGELLWNLTGDSSAALSAGGVLFRNNSNKYIQISTGVSTDAALIYFYKSDGAGGVINTGSISTSGTSTAYNTTSDYRLKNDFKDFSGLDLLTKIKTYDYEWKADKTRSYGVIAHELQSVINYAVTGVKDGKEMQGVDYSKIVPVLIKAVQESHTIIKTLEERIINLEHK